MFCSKSILEWCIYLRENFTDFIRNELPENLLLITCGLPGTWKTETSQEISKIKVQKMQNHKAKIKNLCLAAAPVAAGRSTIVKSTLQIDPYLKKQSQFAARQI